MLHEFSRTEMLIGENALKKLSNSKIAVFGIGGVGTFVVEALARAGVGSFVLVDNDVVCLTNINRQLHATHKTIGRPKVEVMKERVLDINPNAGVETHQCFYAPECSGELIRDDYDYIIDVMDTVTSKVDLVMNAKKAGISVISCMGTGNKLDPVKFEVADIYETSICPLAKVMRKELRQRGVDSLKVVYSRETPVRPSSSAPRDCTSRRQIPGSISFMPSAAGLIIASEVIKDLLGGYPWEDTYE